jgi:hypothetical protein
MPKHISRLPIPGNVLRTVSAISALNRKLPIEHLLWTSQRSCVIFFAVSKRALVTVEKSEDLQGTPDLMILKTLRALGPLHGFGIARRIEQVSEDVLTLNEGTVYTSLLRLQQQGWIDSEWVRRRTTVRPGFTRVRGGDESSLPSRRKIGSASPE